MIEPVVLDELVAGIRSALGEDAVRVVLALGAEPGSWSADDRESVDA